MQANTLKSNDTFSVGIITYLITCGLVLLLMMLAGSFMRMAQGQIINIAPDIFYQLMTAHGVGMVGIAGLSGATIMWHFLSKYVSLKDGVLWINYALFLIGVVLILSSIFLTGFAAGWTFLYPLPAMSAGIWSANAAGLFLGGLAIIGVGFLILHLETARAIIKEYGSLSRALGWPQLFSNSQEPAPPATVVASTMVLIVNTAGIVSGATVLLMSLANLIAPEFTIDPLLAKNLIFFFGHVFINATIYMAVIALYEILPRYVDRPWKVNKVFLAAWTASTIMVLIVYPHHILMDAVMPTWMLVMGQIISYTSGIPVLVVTAYTALVLVHRSGIKWDGASMFLMLSMFGWSVGVIPAIIDGTIVVNRVMHNTMWVPGHFHIYLLLGVIAMLLGFMHYVNRQKGYLSLGIDKLMFAIYAFAGFAFCFMFLIAGSASVPRRWAVHLPEWIQYSQIASVFAIAVVVAMLVIVFRFLTRLSSKTQIA